MIRTILAVGLLAALVFAVGFGGAHATRRVAAGSRLALTPVAARGLSANATLDAEKSADGWTITLRDDAQTTTRRVKIHLPADAKPGDVFTLAPTRPATRIEITETDDLSWAAKRWVARAATVRVNRLTPTIDLAFDARLAPSGRADDEIAAQGSLKG